MRLIGLMLAVSIALALSAGSSADAQSVQRQNAMRLELLERKQILETSLQHGDFVGTRYYLAECELALGLYAQAADNYARALLAHSTHEQRLKSRQALEKLAQMGFLSAYDPNPPRAGARASVTTPQIKPAGRIQSHHDALALRLKQDAARAAEQKQQYFTRAISDIERKLQDDIRHLPKSYTDGRQTVRADNSAEIADLTRVARDRQDKLRYQLQKSLEGIERDKERKLESLRTSATSLDQQTRSESGAVGLVPTGTSMHVRNYVNFPDASEADRYAPPVVPVRAATQKWVRPPGKPPAGTAGN